MLEWPRSKCRGMFSYPIEYCCYVTNIETIQIQLVWSCGLENAITSVVELEKCEYQLTGTTPALCLPMVEAKRDEL